MLSSDVKYSAKFRSFLREYARFSIAFRMRRKLNWTEPLGKPPPFGVTEMTFVLEPRNKSPLLQQSRAESPRAYRLCGERQVVAACRSGIKVTGFDGRV